MVTSGLRERSKARRREAILRSAYRLFADRGFEAATVAEIAAEAEVAPRTVTHYFPSKLDIALAYFDELAEDLAVVLRDRRADGDTLEALERWLREDEEEPDVLAGLADAMLRANPQLKGLCMTRLADVIAEGAASLAHERGDAPGSLAPRMAAAAAAAVLVELGPDPSAADIDMVMAFLKAAVAALPST
ncbi:TetR/AcrR family transcriptional regulator [Spirillospora sp. NPDC050679]